ncbi:MAG: tRNA 2-thiouridine(34) synthase MnmA [Clostridia bacterium]|nr:tRNA 2-thiouridine(34) synthase MnmA [Clostridia bacterium]
MHTLIAMSGGVDSAVTARLILSTGHTAEGCTLHLTREENERKTGSAEDVARARESAAVLGIPHRLLDLSEEFFRAVVLPFCEDYLRGVTPNPCILCNQRIKLGWLYDYARREGFDCLATGHYARIEVQEGQYRLKKARDPEKDQSYVLYRLREEQLAHLAFPLGELTKAEVRAMAAAAGLVAAAGAKESQDICFVPSGRYTELMERVTGRTSPEGNYVDRDGCVLGRHRGIAHYTLGQHKGLGIALGRVRYVTAIDPVRNEVTLGDEEDLFTDTVRLPDMHYIGKRPTAPYRATAKLRYRQREEAVTVYPDGDGARLVFDRPQRAPTVGQSAVVYEGDYVLGGGIIGKEE